MMHYSSECLWDNKSGLPISTMCPRKSWHQQMLHPSTNSVLNKESIFTFLHATTFSYLIQNQGFTWWGIFVVVTLNVNLDTKPISQLFAVALCACNHSHLLNRKMTKMVLHLRLCLKSYHQTIQSKSYCLLVKIAKECSNQICKQWHLVSKNIFA